MEDYYKRHLITSVGLAIRDTKIWKPSVSIFCLVESDEDVHVIKKILLEKRFTSGESAARAGLEFARDWIDDGKPELPES